MSACRRAMWVTSLFAMMLLLSAGCGGRSRSKPEPKLAAEARRETQIQPQIADTSRTTEAGIPLRDAPDVHDRVIAVVNSDVITLSEFQEALAFYLYESKATVKPEEMGALKERLLNRMIERRVQLQEAKREEITVDEAEINEQLVDVMKRFNVKTEAELKKVIEPRGVRLAGVKKRLRERLMVQKVIQRKVRLRVSVTEGEIEKYFLENRDKLETGLAYRARHILLAPESPKDDAAWEAARGRADAVWAKVRDDEEFAELAKRYSDDPTAQDGGNLGVLKQGEITPQLEGQILRLRPGEVTAPFRSTLGFHVFKLEWRESLSGEALKQAKRQIRDILLRQKYAARLEAWLSEIKKRAIIEVRL